MQAVAWLLGVAGFVLPTWCLVFGPAEGESLRTLAALVSAGGLCLVVSLTLLGEAGKQHADQDDEADARRIRDYFTQNPQHLLELKRHVERRKAYQDELGYWHFDDWFRGLDRYIEEKLTSEIARAAQLSDVRAKTDTPPGCGTH